MWIRRLNSLAPRGARLAMSLLAALVVLGPRAVAAADSPIDPPIDPKYDPSKVTAPPLKPITKVTPERVKLKNGIVVYLLENHDLPVVTGTSYAKSTPLFIPNDKVGLGTITGEAMRSGGSTQHAGDWLDDRLGAIGASISTDISADLATSGFRSLTENVAEVTGLWSEVLKQPALPDDKIELSKVGLRREIASRNDEMFDVLRRVAATAVYGKDSPYARFPEYATVEAVTRADCVDLHRKLFEPSRTVIAVYGDFKSADMKKLLTNKFGSWKGANIALPAQPPVPADIKPRLLFAPKEDVTQSGIVLTHLGFRADDPDYPPMDVYSTALGGGFQSRLVNEIRTKRGLAYATGSSAGEGYLRPGVFLAYSLTRGDSTMTALDLLRKEVKRTVDAPFTDEELRVAKQSVENGFVFNFERPSSVLFRAAYFDVVGYPQDFLQTYQKGLQSVNASSVQAAAQRKVHPDKFVAVVVGKEKDFDKPLESAGLPVERVDITIPPPPSKKAAAGPATPEALSKGQALLGKACELAGGSAAWKEIKSCQVEQAANVTMQGQSVALTTSVQWRLPDHMLSVQKLPFGESKQGYDGSAGWVSFGGQVKDEPKAAENVKQEWERSFFHLFSDPASVQVQAADKPETIGGVSYRVGHVKSDVVHDWSLYFDNDGRLAGMSYQGEGPNGPAERLETYADWKPVGKVQYPHTRKVLMDGEPFLDAKVNTISFGGTIDDSAFKKPAQ
jgi:zinc protease